MATSSSKVYQQISENIRKRAQGEEPYKPYKVQTSYGSRTVGEREYLKKVQQRTQELEQEKLNKRQEEMKARGYTTPEQQMVYNRIQDAADYAAAVRRAGLNVGLKDAAAKLQTGSNKGINLTEIKLRGGLNKAAISSLEEQIKNENDIIKNQGRKDNDPAVINAKKTLAGLEARKTNAENQLAALPKSGEAQRPTAIVEAARSLTGNKSDRERMIRDMYGNLQKGNSQIGNIPLVYNDRAKQMIHTRDAAQVVDEDSYVQWLMQAANAGMMKPEEEANARRYAFYHGMPDAANSREYSDYLRKGIESGMFDNDGDLSLMSTGKLQSELADFKRRKAQAEANSRNKDEINTELYDTMGQRGVYENLEVNGLFDPYTQQYHKAKPEDYNEWDVRNGSQESTELSTYYDSLLYDSIHGQGAYNNILNNGTDAEFDAADAEIQELWARLENGTIGQLGDQYNDRISELQGAAYGGESNLDREIRKRQEELTRRQTIGQYAGMEGAAYDPSLIDPETEAGYRSELIRLQNEGGAPAENKTEWLYWIINNISDKEHDYGGGFLGELTGVQQAEQGYRKYSFMTDEMIGQFNALYESGKVKEAQAFMDAIDPYITQLASGRAEELRYNASKGNFGGLYGAMTILRQPIAGLSGTMGSLAALLGNEDAKNPNSGWYKWQKMNNTTRGARAEVWGDFFADKFGEQYRGAGEWLNGVTYSIADNIMAMVLTKGAGKAFGYEMSSKAAERMIQFVMSSSAASSSMVDKISQGMDPTEAALYAVGNGMIEAITEKYSIEALLKPNIKDMLGDWKKVGKFLLKNTIAEGTEEGASDVLNTVWDEVLSGIYGHESELSAQYKELIAQGMSPKDATRQVLRGWLANTGSDMLAGALSGFVMSGGRTAMNTVQQQRAGAKIRNKSNTTAGKTGVEQLIEAARGMDESTESRRMAEELNEKVQSGKKVSSGEAGRLAQNILYETNETMGNIARDTVERMVRDTMKENGATPEQIERTAGIVTDAVVKNKKLTKGEMATVAEVKQAIEAYRHLMTNEGKLEAGMTVRMNPEGDATRSVRETVGRLLNGESAEKVDHRISRDIMQGVQSMVLANDEDLANVQNGKRTKTGMDAIVDNEIVQVTGKEGDSYIVKTADGMEKKVSAAAVTAVDSMAGAIMAYTEGNGRSVLGDEAFGTIAKGAEQNKKMAPAKYIAEAMKVYMAARTGGQMPGTTLAEETASSIWTAAQEENRQATQDRQAAGQLKVEAGKGTASFDGAEYGTDAWKEKIRGLSKRIRNQMGAVAEYAKRIGLHVDFINDPENEAIFGSEDRSTGRITINVAGREADMKIGGKTVLGENHHLLVVAAHEFTHWLEQNSTESYDDLRQFIFDKIRSRGQSVEALVMNKIDAYRSVAKQDLSVEDAMAEIVADACDQVLGSEKVAREIEHSNPNLYSKIKSFVTNLVARIRAAAAGMSTSASAEARLLQDWADELEDRWLKTLQEAQGRKKETQNKEKTESVKQLSIRNISEQDQAYADAVERGDIQAATDMLMDKLANSENIIPFNAPEWYAGEHMDVAKMIKQLNSDEVPAEIMSAAEKMASYVPDNGVLVPMPNHHGEVNEDTDTMILARVISEMTGRPVVAALAGADRESRFKSKENGGKGIQAEEMGFRQVEELPEGTIPIFIDNVVGSGVTAQAARQALGGGITLAYAKSVRSKGIEGLKRATITYDKNGKLIPLSERFNPNVRDIRFSMQAPVEQNADGLIAVHNIRENEFIMTLKEEGFTAPSIAVIFAKTGHTKYGDISVVFNKNTIDPEKMLANKVYGADAWTPTRGNAQIATKLNYEVLAAAKEKLSNILTGNAKVWELDSHNWINQWLYEDETSNTIDDMIDKAWTNDGVIMAYYLDKGNKLEMQKTRFQNIEGLREEEIPMYNAFLDGLAEAGMRGEFRVDMENNQIGVKGAMDKFELIAKYKDIFRKGGAQEEKIVSVYDADPDSKLATNVLWRKIVKSYEFLQDGRQIKTTEKDDIRGTAQETRYKINKDEFGKWIKGLVGKALGKRGVYNGRDPFTRSGEKRSFEQLYMEPTAENIVRAMYANHERKGGEAGGATGLMAKASKEYRNIAEVREDAENRLKVMDEEEYKQLVKDLDKRINEFAEEAKETAGWDYYTIRELLIEAGGEYARAGEDAVRRFFKRENVKLTEKQINEALELMKTAQEIPAGYFEAKPERVVGLDEIARVILPATASQELFDAMNERGIPYDTYDGTDADRLAKLNSVKNVQFSVRQLDDAYMRAARTGDIETMDTLVKEAAKRKGFDTREIAYHGTDSFGFTDFDIDASQGAIFVSYSKMLAKSYTEHTGNETKKISEAPEIPNKNMETMKPEELARYAEGVMKQLWDKDSKVSVSEENDNVFDVDFPRWNKKWFRRHELIKVINEYLKDRGGVYEFYTRPGKQFVIDARGRSWNRIKFNPEDMGKTQNLGRLTPYELWLDGDEKAKEQLESIIKNTWKTREIAAWAKENGYNSIRINNVYDDGGKNKYLVDREFEWQNMELTGDIAIFFNTNDVKSADTITYDDDGSIIPPSERFSDESNDLRFSIRQGNMEINRWMEGLTASSLQTEQERTMLKQWKNTRGSLDLARHALFGYRSELSKLEAKPNPTAYEKHQMSVLRSRIETWQKKADILEEKLAKATSEKGFAAIMRKQSRIMNDLVNGRTADEVRGTVDAINAELETVQKEMEERSERLKQLAAKEAVIRIRQQMNSAGLKRIAAKLKNDLNSELSNTEIENRLALMALKMKEGKIDEADVTELADMLIGKMRRTYDSYILDELRGRTITLSKSQQAELKGQNRTIREIRQELAGTGIRIDTKGGNTLDKNWSELCDLIPALDKEAADKDMLDQLLNVIAAEKEAARNQYAANMDMEVASMVIDAASNLVPEIVTDKKSMQLIRETLNFIAEMSTEAEESARALEELNSLMTHLQKKGREAKATLGTMESNIQDAIAYNNELSLQSEQANWLTERHKLIDQLKSEHTQEMLRQQAEFRLRIEKDKTARSLMNENMALRRRIHTNISRIRNLLMKESVKQNIPEHMKGLAREMLDRIVRNDMSGRKITGLDLKMLQETRRVLDAWEKQDGKYNPEQLKGLDEAVQDAVYNAMEDIKAGIDFYNASTRGSELQVNLQAFKNALTRISDGVSAITGIINAERSIALGDRRVAVEDQAYKVQESAGDKRAKELTGSLGRTIAALRKAVTSGNLTPEYFFKMLKNAGLNDLWEEYHRAENRNGLELAKSKAKLDEIAQKYGYKSWDTDARQEVKLASGSVNMTLGQIMSLYATWKREHTLGPAMSQHLQNGGFYVEEYDPRKGILGRRVVDLKAHRVTEADMEMVNSLLTDEQKKFVDDIVAYMSTDMSELGNEASMKAYGIKMYKESYYFPFKMWDGIKARASNDSGSAAAANDRAFHPSFSKTRLHGANNALMLGDFMTTAADHIVGMINYATMGLANENLQKVLNAQVPEGDRLDQMTRRTIRTVLEEAYGRAATEYIAKLQEQLNGGAVRVDRTIYDRMLTLFRKNAVAGSLSVALQQPLSYIRAAMMINPKYMTEALAREYWKGSYQERLKHSGVSVIKDMGRFDMGFGQGAREYITPEGKEGKARQVWDAITDKATILPEMMDRWTWNRLWVAVKAEQHAQHPDMDVHSDEFLDMAGERFNDIVRKTQVYDSTLTKSQNMRSQNPFVKSITSFMAEPTLSLNVLADAVQNAKEKGGKAKLVKALATFALSAMAQAAAKALMSTGRTPDDKKTWMENYLYRYYANLINEGDPLNLIPGYNDIITLLKNGKLEDDAMGVLGKLFTAGDKLAGAFKEGAGYRDIEDSFGQIVQLFTQLPAKNIMRDLRAMYNWFIGKPYADRPDSAAVIRLQTEASLMTADNLIGVISAKLGEAGYKTTNKGYYGRMFDAMQNGNQTGADEIREYLQLAKGVKDDAIASGLRTQAKEKLEPAEASQWMIDQGLMSGTSTITTQFKKGEITETEAKKLYKAEDPKLTEDDIWWKIDRIKYQQETGEEVGGSAYYYRLTEAINNNKAAEIQEAVKTLLKHGITKEKIKSKLSDWKQAYLEADNAGKVKIRDAIQKAYKAAGYTAEDANKVINNWKKNK